MSLWIQSRILFCLGCYCGPLLNGTQFVVYQDPSSKAAPPNLQILVCAGLLGYLIPGAGLYTSLELQIQSCLPTVPACPGVWESIPYVPNLPPSTKLVRVQKHPSIQILYGDVEQWGAQHQSPGSLLVTGCQQEWKPLMITSGRDPWASSLPVLYTTCLVSVFPVCPGTGSGKLYPTFCWSPAKQHPLLSPYGQKVLPCRRWPNQSGVTCLCKFL